MCTIQSYSTDGSVTSFECEITGSAGCERAGSWLPQLENSCVSCNVTRVCLNSAGVREASKLHTLWATSSVMPANRHGRSVDTSRSLSLSSLSEEDEAWVKEALSQQQVFAIQLSLQAPVQDVREELRGCRAAGSDATAPEHPFNHTQARTPVHGSSALIATLPACAQSGSLKCKLLRLMLFGALCHACVCAMQSGNHYRLTFLRWRRRGRVASYHRLLDRCKQPRSSLECGCIPLGGRVLASGLQHGHLRHRMTLQRPRQGALS